LNNSFEQNLGTDSGQFECPAERFPHESSVGSSSIGSYTIVENAIEDKCITRTMNSQNLPRIAICCKSTILVVKG
jgi:hypothetical protein